MMLGGHGNLAQQIRIKCAVDEKQLLNPGKVFPVLRRYAELGRMHVHGGGLLFPTFRDVEWRRSARSPRHSGAITSKVMDVYIDGRDRLLLLQRI